MRRHLSFVLALACAAGCEPAADPVELDVAGKSEVAVIEGAPAAGTAATRIEVELGAAPSGLAAIGGVMAVGTGDGVRATNLGDDQLDELAVHPDQEGPKQTGAVRWLARRADDGLLVLGEQGLFHAASGYLLSSPLGQSVNAAEITTITSYGAAEEEELWLTTESGASWVADGKITSFSLKASADRIMLAIGTAPGQAVVVAGQSAYFVDVRAHGAVEIGADLGAVNGGDVAEDGTVHLATSAGLLSRTRSGELTLRTLADAGEPAQPVLAVSARFGSVLALTSESVVSIDGSGATRVGDGATGAGALGVDANGDAWAIEDGALVRYQTGRPVSFASDVAPFAKEHCDSCHALGATSAPDHDFTDFETAKQWSDSIVRRLQATDATTMPPPSTEVLTASDYAIVLRWVKGGLLP